MLQKKSKIEKKFFLGKNSKTQVFYTENINGGSLADFSGDLEI